MCRGLVAGEPETAGGSESRAQSPEPEQGAGPREQVFRVRDGNRAHLPQAGRSPEMK